MSEEKDQTAVVSCIRQPQFEWEAEVRHLNSADTMLKLVADGRKGKNLNESSVLKKFMTANVSCTSLKQSEPLHS